MTIYLSPVKAFKPQLRSSENTRIKSYAITTHGAVTPKVTHYTYMQSMHYTVYNG